jgi:hypothetical protein
VVSDAFTTLLGVLTFLVGVAGAIKAGTMLTRKELKDTVEVQHTIWEETRTALKDCQDELRTAKGGT